MNAFAKIRQHLERLPITDMVQAATEKQKPVIEDMNAEQLNEGTDSAGVPIAPAYRNPEYAVMKQMMNSKPSPGVPDLKLTGAFHRSISVQFDNAGFTLTASDEKSEMLQGKYGDKIIGISEASVSELQEGYILPELRDSTLNYLREWKR